MVCTNVLNNKAGFHVSLRTKLQSKSQDKLHTCLLGKHHLHRSSRCCCRLLRYNQTLRETWIITSNHTVLSTLLLL